MGKMSSNKETTSYDRHPAYMYGDLERAVEGVPLATTKNPREKYPVASGFLDYFPDAIREAARCSLIGNEQHNPGEPLLWDREKSTEHADKAMRHFQERGTVDDDGVRHSVKALWRMAALVQLELEEAGEAPLSRHNQRTTGEPIIRG